eukprot:7963418-Lingulodinium_polyedra.AAC.1
MDAPLAHGLKFAPHPSFGHWVTSPPKRSTSWATHAFMTAAAAKGGLFCATGARLRARRSSACPREAQQRTATLACRAPH